MLREPPTYDFGPALWRGADIDVDGGSDDVIVIPDAAFLFNADFKKAGRDLLIIGDDGRKVVVHDYFAHDKRPDLASREGATIAGYVVDAIVKQTSPTEYAQAGTPSNSATPIGRVEKVTGNAIAIRNGVPVTLNAGDLVFQGDVVQTRAGSTLGIAFIDGSAFNLSANARMVLNELVYDPNGTANSSLVNLVQGTISFVAGQVAKTGDMKVGTPVATMGIRGTIVIVEMAAENGPTKIRTVFDPQTGKPGEIVAYSNANPTEVIGRLNVETLALQITPLSNLNVVVAQVPVSPLEISSSRELSARLIEISNAALQNPIIPGVMPPAPDGTSPGGIAPGGAGGGGGGSSTPPNNLGGGGTNSTTTTGALTATTTAFTTPTTILFPSDNGGGAGGGRAGGGNALPVLVADTSAAHTATPIATGAVPNSVSLSDGTLPFTDQDKDDTHQAFVQGASAQWTSGAGAAVTTAIPAETANALGSALTVGIAAESGEGLGTVSWSFAFAQSLSRFLGAGEHLAVTYTIQVSDGSGQSAPRTVTVVLVGENDNPELSLRASGSDTEISGITGGPGSHTVAGSLGFTDPDLTDTHGVAATLSSVLWEKSDGSGVAGTFPPATLAALAADVALALSGQDSTGTGNGTVGWTFSVADSAFDFLAAGEKLVITYNLSVDDGEGGVATQPVTIAVFGANDAPAFAAGGSHTTGSTEDATTLTIVGKVAFTDPDRSDIHGVAVAANLATPGNIGSLIAGVLTDTTGTGEGGVVGWGYTVNQTDVHALAGGETRTDRFIITIGDDHTATATQTVSLTLVGENDAPVLTSSNPALAGIDEDDSNNNGQTVAAILGTSVGDVDHGAVAGMAILGTEDGNGHWEYRLAGKADWQAIALDGNALLLGEQDSVRFVPDERAGTTASFTYRAWDTTNAAAPGSLVAVAATGGTSAFSDDTDTATIAVGDVNDAPVAAAAAESNTTNEDTAVTGMLLAGSDIDEDALTFALVVGSAVGGAVTIDAATGGYTFTPASNFHGAASFQYLVSDGSLESAPKSVSITVAAVTDLTAANDTFSTNEDIVLSASVAGNDATTSGGVLSYAKATDPGHGTVTVAANGDFHYTPASNFQGPDSFTYTVTDAASGESATRSVSITVAAVTDLTAANDTFSTNEDIVLSASVAGNDATTSGGVLSYAKATDPGHGTVTVAANGDFHYTPASNFQGPDSFTYTVTDAASGESATRSVSITVAAVTDLTAANDTFSTNEDIVLSASVAGNDATTSGGVLSYAKATDPGHGTVTVAANGDFHYTPASNFQGPDSFTYTVTDAASGESATRSVSITVAAVTDLTAANDTFSTNEDIVLSASVAGNDATTSGGVLSYAKATDPGHGTVTVAANGDFHYTPASNFQGPDSFTYTVTDAASGESATRSVSITVAAVTDLTAANDTFSTNEDIVLSASVAGNDATTSGGVLSYAKATDPGHGTVTVAANGDFHYTPASNFQGPDSFTYTVTDAASGESATRSVSITVAAVTDLTAANDTFSTNEDIVLSASVAGNDATTSGGVLSYAKATDPGHGTVTVAANGDFHYTPASNFQGPDSFTYTVTDAASGESATRSVSITVAAVTDLTAANDTFSTNEDIVLSASVAGNDATTSGGVLSYAKATDPGHGTVTVAANGDFHYTPASNFQGPDSFTYTVTDAASGESATRSVSITVAAVTADANDYDQAALNGAGQNPSLTNGFTVTVGSQNNDSLNPGSGKNAMYGKAGNDTLNGDNGVDFLYGGSGDDTLHGMNGNDHLYGGSGNDKIFGETGSDILVGGAGSDTLSGGDQGDTYQYWSAGDAGDKITDFLATEDDFEFVVANGTTHTIDGTTFAGGFGFANQNIAGSANVLKISDVGSNGAPISGADIVIWTGTANDMNELGEVDTFLKYQNGTFNGAVVVAAYSQVGNVNNVAIYYDSDADGLGGTTLLATLTNLTSTATLSAANFHFMT